MAVKPPDLSTLESWEEAFQYPVITTRRIEQQLRGDVTTNKEKLRTLVGTSYRDLLGTAETIIHMDKQIQSVESNLAHISQNCNSRTLERKSGNTLELQKRNTSQSLGKQATAAQLAVLHKCQTSISRILRKHGSILLAAKTLVLSRLLHKTLSTNSGSIPILETLRAQLSTLRRSLLKKIDRSLGSLTLDADSLVEVLCAFCLATSSTSADAIRHFHHLRMEEIASCNTQDEKEGSRFLYGLRLFVRTLQDTTGLLGRPFSDSLSALRNRPLIQDPQLRSLDSLNLGMYQSWLAADVRNFTPWIKLHDPSRSEAKNVLDSWSRQAFQNYLTYLNSGLDKVESIEDLLGLRKQLMESWLPFHYSTPCHSAVEVFKGLQDSINRRLVSLLHAEAEELMSVVENISTVIAGWNDASAKQPTSLWEADLVEMNASHGAAALKTELRNRQLGRSEEVSRTLQSYDSWLSSIRKSGEDIQDLRRARWEDLLEEDDNEDELDGLTISKALSKRDPDLFISAQKSSITKILESFQTELQDITGRLDSPYKGKQAAFVLRVVRDIRQSNLLESHGPDKLLFLNSTIPNLHSLVAKETLRPLFPLNIGSRKHSRRTLWEGDPPLPVQPSPATFKLLRRVTSAMTDAGTDIWSPTAVDNAKKVLRSAIRDKVSHLGHDQVDGVEERPAAEEGRDRDGEHVNGDAVLPMISEAALSDGDVQTCFDLCYLDCAFAVVMEDDSAEGDNLVESFHASKGIDDRSRARLQKAASDYWNRTSLLFGLLVA